jgi:hypothetical protein
VSVNQLPSHQHVSVNQLSSHQHVSVNATPSYQLSVNSTQSHQLSVNPTPSHDSLHFSDSIEIVVSIIDWYPLLRAIEVNAKVAEIYQ